MVDLIHKRCRNMKGPKEQSPTLSSHDCVKSRTLKRSIQSILKEINPKYLLEGLMLKLKLQNFGHLMCRADSLRNILMLGKIEDRRRRGWQRMRWLDGIRLNGCEFEQTPGDNEGQGSLTYCRPWSHKELDTTEWLSNNNKQLKV